LLPPPWAPQVQEDVAEAGQAASQYAGPAQVSGGWVKTEYTEEEIEYIFNQHFRNRLFDVQMELQELHQLFHILSGSENAIGCISDSFNLVDRDISITRNAIQQTITDLDRRVANTFQSQSVKDDWERRKAGKSKEEWAALKEEKSEASEAP
jgi:hypothetical protein